MPSSPARPLPYRLTLNKSQRHMAIDLGHLLQAVRHLEAYSFPGNITELEAIVMRATAQVAPGAEVNADVFWFASQVRGSDRPRRLTHLTRRWPCSHQQGTAEVMRSRCVAVKRCVCTFATQSRRLT